MVSQENSITHADQWILRVGKHFKTKKPFAEIIGNYPAGKKSIKLLEQDQESMSRLMGKNNVIFTARGHDDEADHLEISNPQAIAIFLEKIAPQLVNQGKSVQVEMSLNDYAGRFMFTKTTSNARSIKSQSKASQLLALLLNEYQVPSVDLKTLEQFSYPDDILKALKNTRQCGGQGRLFIK